MKTKFLGLLTAVFFMSTLAAIANTPTTSGANNTHKLKSLATKYVNAELSGNKSSATSKLAQDMYKMGAKDMKIITYSPCPNRGTIKIDGKSINATNKRCIVLQYQYNNKKQEAGACK